MAKKKTSSLQVNYLSTDALILAARNARTHSEKQVAQIAASIREFGWTNPILLDGKKGVIAGHGRILAARQLGIESIPCIELRHLSPEQRRAYAIADNRLALSAGWDTQLLELEIKELQVESFDLDLLGFSGRELEALLREDNQGGVETSSQEILEGADLKMLAPTAEERKILKGRELVIEYSGGKDSSAAAIWTKHYFPNAKILLFYIDLGAEYHGFFFFLKRFAEALGCKLKVGRAKENIIAAMLERNEWPFFVGPWCHDILHEPLYELLRSYPPEKVACIRGGRMKEKARVAKKQTSRFLIIEKMKGYVYFQPLYYATKEAAVDIITKAGMPIWEGYSTGLQRTACRICPGQRAATYAAVRANHPEIWLEQMELERRLGPGCWQGSPGSSLRASFKELAERGQKAFEANISQKST